MASQAQFFKIAAPNDNFDYDAESTQWASDSEDATGEETVVKTWLDRGQKRLLLRYRRLRSGNQPDFNTLQSANRFDEFYISARKLDKHRLDIAKINRSIVDEDVPQVPQTLNRNALNADLQNCLATITAVYEPNTIQFPSTLVWNPLCAASNVGLMPAIDMPPHRTYRLELPVDERYKDRLSQLWTKESDIALSKAKHSKSANALATAFFTAVRNF